MIYFDNAATTFPKPKEVIEKYYEVSKDYCANPGRSGHKMALRMDREIFEARENLTKFLGGKDPLNTIFTFNCTDSLNTAIKGLIVDKCHVVTTSMEHNSVLRPLNELAKRGAIELTIVDADDKGILKKEDIEKAIKENTDLVVTTNMSNLTGTIVDIKEIGKMLKKRGIKYIVDGAQSVGVLDIDISEIDLDILCFPGHKGLLGPQGTGGLIIKNGAYVRSFREGGTGSFSQDPFQPSIYPDRLESGTPNGPGIIALNEGVKFIQKVGLKNIRDHEESLKELFIENMKRIDGIKIYGSLDQRQGAVVSINLEGMDSSEIAYILNDEYDIYIRPGLHCAPLAHKTIGTLETGSARFSFGYFNTKEEVNRASEILEKIAKENR